MNSYGITTVTLDVGGTLLFPYPSVGDVYAEVMADHGIEVARGQLEERFRRMFALTRVGPRAVVDDSTEKEFWRGLVREVIGDFCREDGFEALFEDLYDAFANPDRWRTAADAVSTIEELTNRGYRLAVLSNADSRLRHVLEVLGISGLVEKVFISAEVGFEKPDPRIFRHVEQVLQVQPFQVVHVGDSQFHDGDGARAAGWSPFVLGGRFDPDTGTIACLGDLLSVLGKPAGRLP
jgi:putative hydrolase of the HAD superfamily